MRKIDTLIKIIGDITAIVLAILIVLVLYDATVRYLFHSGSIALQELEWHLFDVVILLGIAYTLQKNAHVRVDIFYDRFSDKTKAYIDLVSLLLFVIPFSLLIIYVGSDFVMLSFAQQEASSDPGGLPYRFIVKSLMPLAFTLVILQSLSGLYKAYKKIRGLS